MHFAKLFTYSSGGQLLVTRRDADDAEHEESPYLLITETRAGGVTAKMEHGYSLKAMRDADFESFKESKAADFYTTQQKFLAQMAS